MRSFQNAGDSANKFVSPVCQYDRQQICQENALHSTNYVLWDAIYPTPNSRLAKSALLVLRHYANSATSHDYTTSGPARGCPFSGYVHPFSYQHCFLYALLFLSTPIPFSNWSRPKKNIVVRGTMACRMYRGVFPFNVVVWGIRTVPMQKSSKPHQKMRFSRFSICCISTTTTVPQ